MQTDDHSSTDVEAEDHGQPQIHGYSACDSNSVARDHSNASAPSARSDRAAPGDPEDDALGVARGLMRSSKVFNRAGTLPQVMAQGWCGKLTSKA